MDPLILFLAYLFYGLVQGAAFCLMGMGMSLIYGIMGVANLAHGELMMLGGYIAFFSLTLLGGGPVVALVLVSVSLFGVGMLTDKVLLSSLRRRVSGGFEWSALIVTVGFSLMLQTLALLFWGGDAKRFQFLTGYIDFFGAPITLDRLFILACAIFVTLGVYLFFSKTLIGKSIRATAQNRTGATLVGVNTNLMYPLAFGIAAMLAGIAGALVVPIYLVYPTSGIITMSLAFAVTNLGGVDYVEGSIAAGFTLGIVYSLMAGYVSANWIPMVSYGVAIGALMIKPKGLMSRR